MGLCFFVKKGGRETTDPLEFYSQPGPGCGPGFRVGPTLQYVLSYSWVLSDFFFLKKMDPCSFC